MKLSAPKFVVFLISVILGAIALISTFIAIPFVSGIAFWILLIAFLLLVAGVMLKGL